MLFPTMETQLYFQVPGKFHTIFHSFAFHKASLFPWWCCCCPVLRSACTGARGCKSARACVVSAQLGWTKAFPLLFLLALQSWGKRCNAWATKQTYAVGLGFLDFFFFNWVTSQRKKPTLLVSVQMCYLSFTEMLWGFCGLVLFYCISMGLGDAEVYSLYCCADRCRSLTPSRAQILRSHVLGQGLSLRRALTSSWLKTML